MRALFGHDAVEQVDRSQLALAPGRWVGGRELDYLAGDDRRYLMLGRRFRERARADLVAERAVAEDRVRTDEEER